MAWKACRSCSPASYSMCADSLARKAERRVDPLAAVGQHGGHRILGQPVHLQVRLQGAELGGDGQVPPGVPQPDRRAEVQHPWTAARGPHPRRPGRGRGHQTVDDLADQLVHAHRVAGGQAVPGAVQQHQGTAGQLGKPLPARRRDHLVRGAVQHGDGAAHPPADRFQRGADRAVQAQRARNGVGQGRGCDLQTPPDAVLDLLGGVRLAEHRAEEELQELGVATLAPAVLVELPPAGVLRQPLVVGVPVPAGPGKGEPAGRGDGDQPEHPLRVVRGQVHRPAGPPGQGDQHRLPGVGGVQHRQGVGGELLVGVGRRPDRPVGIPAAPPVEGDHPVVPGQIAQLRLPEPRGHDRPGGHQQQGRVVLGAEHPVGSTGPRPVRRCPASRGQSRAGDLVHPGSVLARPPGRGEVRHRHGRISSTLLKGVLVAARNRPNPAVVETSRIRAGPAWVPSASPTSWDSDAGVHSSVEKP